MNANQGGLAEVLRRNRLQQKHVAEALGVSKMTVWAWVHGRAVPTGKNLTRLADFLRGFEKGVEERDLFATVDHESGAVA